MNWLSDAINKCLAKTHVNAQKFTNFPHITERGKYVFTSDGVWTGGFWSGILWLAYQRNPSPALLTVATHFTERLLPRANDRHNHDLGFMFYPSAIAGWRLTHQAHYKQAALTAASSLAAQFNQRAGFIPGWGFFGGEEWSTSVLIDTLMNLPLLAWAVKNGGDPALLAVIERHTTKALSHHLRANGSVFHVYHFTEEGTGVRGDTYQGLSADSAWARGQGWAITGLALLADALHNHIYLETAEKVAEFILSHLPTDHIPFWDYDDQRPDAPKDASAGAISAYGLLRLYRLTGKERYKTAARTILQALAACCIVEDNEGLLAHSTADLPHGLGIDQATGYGDYYFLKALYALETISTDS
ncbi:unsaturated chondroitin disaccharide hydrolase [Raoultella sp. BIGb0138]|uniref:glycoside hydrolase family 88 protein n=1 Tax=Raoultella sp. BIGb0138 TaxID=2485115 RepID=UPI001045FC08|nr:glycoside hydrolase family 88 protein [Raoultella sp. BIGb0138]TCW06496.1 unsaturated chondroitin disaccharide hydrolase [Raoultella sp. BIGb0138]